MHPRYVRPPHRRQRGELHQGRRRRAARPGRACSGAASSPAGAPACTPPRSGRATSSPWSASVASAINAVQGARLAGAKQIWAIDPVEFKRSKAMEFGATHTAASLEEAAERSARRRGGRMADKVVMTMGVGSGELLAAALAITAKRGRVVVTNIHPALETSANISLLDLTLMEKQVVGSLFGSGNPRPTSPSSSSSTTRADRSRRSGDQDVPARRRQRRLRRHARRQQPPRRPRLRVTPPARGPGGRCARIPLWKGISAGDVAGRDDADLVLLRAGAGDRRSRVAPPAPPGCGVVVDVEVGVVVARRSRRPQERAWSSSPPAPPSLVSSNTWTGASASDVSPRNIARIACMFSPSMFGSSTEAPLIVASGRLDLVGEDRRRLDVVHHAGELEQLRRRQVAVGDDVLGRGLGSGRGETRVERTLGRGCSTASGG